MKYKFKFGLYLLFSVVLTLGFSVSFQSLLAAWNGPVATPPNGSTGTIIFSNVGATQAIIGGLGIGGNFSVDILDNTLFVDSASDRIGIGTVNPQGKLHVVGGNIEMSGYLVPGGEGGDGFAKEEAIRWKSNTKTLQVYNGTDWVDVINNTPCIQSCATGPGCRNSLTNGSNTSGVCCVTGQSCYDCAMNYTWNGSICLANTRTYTCPAKPAGSDWNSVGSYTQTWSGSAWMPLDSTTVYNTTASLDSCRYKCSANYTWNGSSCVANTTTYTCPAKPAVGTVWNSVSSYNQTWNGSTYLPAGTATVYNTTASTVSCRYICATGYVWNTSNSTCIANPCSINYFWNGSSCVLKYSYQIYAYNHNYYQCIQVKYGTVLSPPLDCYARGTCNNAAAIVNDCFVYFGNYN